MQQKTCKKKLIKKKLATKVSLSFIIYFFEIYVVLNTNFHIFSTTALPSYTHATSEDIMTPGGKFSDKPNAKSDFKPVYLCYGCAEADTAI